jgi:hypothetical protein
MPSIKNSATNKNDINIKVIVGDVVKKRKPRRRAAPSGGSGPPAPPPSVINNIMPSSQPTTQATSYNDPPPPPPLLRSGASMMNRPYDVVDAGVGTVGEDAPEGLRSNFEAYQATRERYFMSLQEQMEDLAGTEFTDLTVAPSEADGSIQHGAQGSPPQWQVNDSYLMPDEDTEVIDSSATPEALPHRSGAFALPPTQAPLALPPTEETEEPTPSALPGPSRGRKRTSAEANLIQYERAVRSNMVRDGWLEGSERATAPRRQEYEAWVASGKLKHVKPSWWKK